MYIDWLWIIILALVIGFAGMVVGRQLGLKEYHQMIQRQIRHGKLKEVSEDEQKANI